MPSIAELLLAQGAQAAETRRRLGEISGQMWGNIGNTIAQIPGQIEQQKRASQENELRGIQLQNARQLQSGNQLLDRSLSGGPDAGVPNGPQPEGAGPAPAQHPYLDEQGLIDPTKVQQLFNANGMAHVAPEILQRIDAQNSAISNFQQSQQKLKTEHAIALGRTAHTALGLMDSAGMDFPTATTHAAQPLVATGLMKPEDVQSAVAQGAQLPPDQQRAFLTSLMDTAAQLGPKKTQKEGDIEFDMFDRPTGAKGAAKVTEADLQKTAMDAYARVAAGTQTANDANIIKGWESVHPKNPPKTTAEQDKERAVNLRASILLHKPISKEDQAWLDSHETEATLGIDKTTSAAWQRLAEETKQSNAHQANAQAFQEQETGKKQVAKIDEDYNKAKAGADNLREIVSGAKAGNTIDASLQNMATTFAEVRAQGLNRVNAVELGLPANAGSAWQRLQAWAGGKIQGQPVPESIQKDMLDFAALLDRAADTKYKQAFDGTLRLYPVLKGKIAPLTDVNAATSTGPTVGTERVINGIPAVWDGKGWKPK